MATVTPQARAAIDQNVARIRDWLDADEQPAEGFRLLFDSGVKRRALGALLGDVLRAESPSACALAWIEFLGGVDD